MLNLAPVCEPCYKLSTRRSFLESFRGRDVSDMSMRTSRHFNPFVLATLALIGATNLPARAGPGNSAAETTAHLQMYTVVADQAGAKAIKAGGYDIASVERAPGGNVRLEVVA